MRAAFRTVFTVLAASLLLAAPAPAGAGTAATQASAVQLLKGMSGIWKGRGTARKSSSAAAEPVSCHYEGKLANNGLTLNLSYVCLGVEFKFETRGSLTFEPAADRFAISLSVAGVDRRVEGTGVLRGSGLDLTLSGHHPDTGKPVSSRLTMALSGGSKLVNVLRSTDPETGKSFQAFSATLSR